MVDIPNPRFGSVMVHNFSNVPSADIPRAQFKKPSRHVTTFDAGFLIPAFVEEILPGTTINMNFNMIARQTTPIKPYMDNLYLDWFAFFTPNRLLWSNWERFCGAQDKPTDTTNYLVPLIDKTTAPLSTTGWTFDSIAGYFGIPMYVTGIDHTALYFRNYNLCWNSWFRDENLQDSVTVQLTDGPDNCNLYVLLKRGKRHDYFTSCLPWPQKINDGTVVTLPLGTSAPVYGNGKGLGLWDATNAAGLYANGSGTLQPWTTGYNVAAGGTVTGGTYESSKVIGVIPKASGSPAGISGLYADLSTATASTINQIRQAFQIQHLYERDSRSGTRYIEVLASHFGVISPDFRLQRPEILGTGSTPIVVNPIVQNTPVISGSTPQGNLAAIGTGMVQGGFTKSFVEHGILMILVSVRADLTYQKSLYKEFTRRSRFDFYWPALCNLGEQAVYNKEIYCDGSANDDLVFGYQERWAEYRYGKSKITGKMNSHYATPLDSWHLAQKFLSLPTLNTTFIQENPPIDRVSAVNTEPHFYFDSYFDETAVLPMPMYSVPGLIDHF